MVKPFVYSLLLATDEGSSFSTNIIDTATVVTCYSEKTVSRACCPNWDPETILFLFYFVEKLQSWTNDAAIDIGVHYNPPIVILLYRCRVRLVRRQKEQTHTYRFYLDSQHVFVGCVMAGHTKKCRRVSPLNCSRHLKCLGDKCMHAKQVNYLHTKNVGIWCNYEDENVLRILQGARLAIRFYDALSTIVYF